MQKFILCVILACAWANADVLIPKPDAPGLFDEFSKNPAVRYRGLRIGLVWTEPMEGVDYEVAMLAAEWGNGTYRFEASFADSFLDSLYRSELVGLDASVSISRWTFGLGGDWDIQYVPGLGSWWRSVGRAGARMDLFWNLSVDAWGEFPSDFEPNSRGIGLEWKPGAAFGAYAGCRFRRDIGWRVSLGEVLHVGRVSIQSVVAYPGPSVGVGILFRFGKIGAGAGVRSVGDYVNSRVASLSFDFR